MDLSVIEYIIIIIFVSMLVGICCWKVVSSVKISKFNKTISCNGICSIDMINHLSDKYHIEDVNIVTTKNSEKSRYNCKEQAIMIDNFTLDSSSIYSISSVIYLFSKMLLFRQNKSLSTFLYIMSIVNLVLNLIVLASITATVVLDIFIVNLPSMNIFAIIFGIYIIKTILSVIACTIEQKNIKKIVGNIDILVDNDMYASKRCLLCICYNNLTGIINLIVSALRKKSA